VSEEDLGAQVTASNNPSFDKGTIPLDVFIRTVYVPPC
jgi:hypothetical protein